MSWLHSETRVVDKRFMQEQLDAIRRTRTGIMTGFCDIDKSWGGLKPGCTYLLASRHDMGKTALAINMMRNIALENDAKVAYFSIDMPNEQIISRLLSMESFVELNKIKNDTLSEDDWDKIAQASEIIANENIIINDMRGISIELLERKLMSDIMLDVKVVFIDYLQLISVGSTTGDRNQDIYNICSTLRRLAVAKNTAIVVLSQISREAEERSDHRPGLSDLMEKDLVKYFDNVTFLYRDEYYNKFTDLKNIAELITAVNRDGAVRTNNLIWIPEFHKFANLIRP